jgi:hypothetical protein
VFLHITRPFEYFQIGIVDPDCRLIGLHLYDGLFKVCFLIPDSMYMRLFTSFELAALWWGGVGNFKAVGGKYKVMWLSCDVATCGVHLEESFHQVNTI